MDLFRSYLCGRSQYVTVNGHVSDSLSITCDVPQGSVLRPLLFLIYVNDLSSISKILEFYLFADDTSIYFESDNLLTLQKIVNRELRKVKKWLETNRLALNISKTNYVIFCSSTTVINEFIRIKVGSKTINQVNYVKYLSVLVDSSLLTWKPLYIIDLSKNWLEQKVSFSRSDIMLPLKHSNYYIILYSFHLFPMLFLFGA